ncbi:lipoprotein [Endozoicomonas sp. SESOKO3]|uniref:LPS translocon maturation chaperone LptM n=1 Tax=Endozoicomonas sp. SESOKO3 TaxID=2828744 RepID=UPI002147CFCA
MTIHTALSESAHGKKYKEPFMRALIALMFTTLLLAGCGQKGDLYLPKDGDTQQLTHSGSE